MAYILKITIILNTKLWGYFFFSTHKDCWKFPAKTVLVFKLFTNQNCCLQITMENFFVYFYSKKFPQNFLPSSKQKVTSNEQKLSSNKQKVTSNEEKVTNEERRVKRNKRRATSKNKWATSKNKRSTSKE